MPVITVLGGGVAGCATALELAEAGYQVKLIERRNELLLGSSNETPCRLGLGFHYPDLETAIKYFQATLKLMQKYPGFRVYEHEITAHPQKRGRYFIVKDSLFELSKILSIYDALKKEYHKACVENPRNKVFGEPSDFYRVLVVEEYAHLVNCSVVSIGIETAGCILDWPKFGLFLLQQIAQHPNIEVFCNTLVEKVSRGYTADREELLFSVQVTNLQTNLSAVMLTDTVVNATWESIEALNHQLGVLESTLTPRTNRAKMMVEVELPQSLANCNSMFFCFGPHCSLTNLGNSRGFLTYEPVTNVESTVEMFLSRRVQGFLYSPEQDLAEKKLLGEQIIQGAARYIPALSQASIVTIHCGIVRTFGLVNISSPDSALHRRRESGVEELQIGLIVNACMKLLYFIGNAEEVLFIVKQMVRAKALIKEMAITHFSESAKMQRVVQSSLSYLPSSIFCDDRSLQKINSTISLKKELMVNIQKFKI